MNCSSQPPAVSAATAVVNIKLVFPRKRVVRNGKFQRIHRCFYHRQSNVTAVFSEDCRGRTPMIKRFAKHPEPAAGNRCVQSASPLGPPAVGSIYQKRFGGKFAADCPARVNPRRQIRGNNKRKAMIFLGNNFRSQRFVPFYCRSGSRFAGFAVFCKNQFYFCTLTKQMTGNHHGLIRPYRRGMPENHGNLLR